MIPEKVSRPLNLIEFSLKKLPIAVPDKLVEEFKGQPNSHFLL